MTCLARARKRLGRSAWRACIDPAESAQAGLTKHKPQPVHALARVWQLSGGEQQRVALARTPITVARIFLLDEPFSALNAALRAEFRQRIALTGMVVVWLTHDEAEARSVGARGLRLQDGACCICA